MGYLWGIYGAAMGQLWVRTAEVPPEGALLVVQHALVVLHEGSEFLCQLQGQILLRRRLRAVHHHRLRRLVQRRLLGAHSDDGTHSDP